MSEDLDLDLDAIPEELEAALPETKRRILAVLRELRER